MKTLLCIAAASLSLLSPLAARAQYYVFKVNAAIPAVMDINGQTSTVIRKTLTDADVVNLALGRPLTTKLNPHTEILALSTTFEQMSTSSPLSTLIVFNPTETGTAQVTTTIANLSNLNWSDYYTNNKNSGQGIATGQFLATTMGTPSQNGFIQSSFTGSGSCAGPHIKYSFSGNQGAVPQKVDPVASAIFISQLQFNFTENGQTTNFNGFVTRGVLTMHGDAIGTYPQD